LLKTRVPPEINAISTIMLVISTALVAVSIAIQGRNASRGNR
jgi:ABC-type spermidine/putrescine transport system permease subunit II